MGIGIGIDIGIGMAMAMGIATGMDTGTGIGMGMPSMCWPAWCGGIGVGRSAGEAAFMLTLMIVLSMLSSPLPSVNESIVKRQSSMLKIME